MDHWNYVFQNAWYVGNNFNTILYGVELVLYFQSLHLIVAGRNGRPFTRSDKTFMSLSTFLLCMITIYVITQNFFGEEMWVMNEGYPGGSAQYFADHAAVWYQLLGSASWVTMNLVSDAFLIYRTYIVWASWKPILVPCILWVGTLALGISTLYFSSIPASRGFFAGTSARVALSYSSVGLALNVACTSLICARILSASRALRRALSSENEVARAYTGAAAVVVESMLPYTLFGALYVGTLGADSPLSILFLSLYAMFNCLSPQMIILRVIMGRGWTTEAATGTVRFRHSTTYADTRVRSPRGEPEPADLESGRTVIEMHSMSPLREPTETDVKIYDMSTDGGLEGRRAFVDV